jgi:hypothetical protein
MSKLVISDLSVEIEELNEEELNQEELKGIQGGNPVGAVLGAIKVGWAIGTAINNEYRAEIGEAIDKVFR